MKTNQNTNRTETSTTYPGRSGSQRIDTLGRSGCLLSSAESAETVLPPWERITLIHDSIESGAFPNSHTLAASLRLSRTTVCRDIAYMRDRLGLPLEYDDLRHGYFYAKYVFACPPHPISELDLIALLVGGRTMSQVRGTRYETKMRNFFRRILPMLSSEPYMSISDLRSYMSVPAPTLDLDAIQQSFTRALKASTSQNLN
jgi:predicted DNA-binding transcriptional regulator YafY